MYSAAIRTNPMMNPQPGERIIGTITFQSSPFPCHQWSEAGCDQMITFQSPPAAPRAAPHNAPISAWLELDGSPNHHVIRFHTIAPSKAQISTCEVTTLVSTN